MNAWKRWLTGLVFAALLPALGFADTVSGSFTSAQTVSELLDSSISGSSAKQRSLTYSVSGTYTGEIFLEKGDSSNGPWTTVVRFLNSTSGQSGLQDPGFYRFRTSALTFTGTADYSISNDETGSIATPVPPYSNATSGLSATDLQAAIDELTIPVRRTANEIAAGIVPLIKTYQPGDLRRYGIVCTDSASDATNNTTRLNALGAATWSSEITFRWPAGVCRINDTVTFSNANISHSFDPNNEINYYGTTGKTIVQIGTSSTSIGTKTLLGGSGIHIENKTTNTYGSESTICLKTMGSMQNNTITTRKISGCTIGWQLAPNTTGFAYNSVNLGVFLDNKIGLDLHSFNSAEFINENLFFGGNWHDSSYSAALDQCGVRFMAEVGAYGGNNRNWFQKPNFEMTDGNSPAIRAPVCYDGGAGRNRFSYARVEGGRGYLVYITNAPDNTHAVFNNEHEFTVLSGTWTGYLHEPENSFAYGNSVTNLADGQVYQKPVWFSGDMLRKAIPASSTTISVKGMFIQGQSAAPAYSGTGRLGRQYVIITGSNSIGVDLDTSFYKQFLVRSDIQAGFGGRFRFVCMDIDGNGLGSSGGPYVMSGSLAGDAHYPAGTGTYHYSTQSDSTTGALYVSFGDSCKYGRIMRSSGTNPLHIRSMEIMAISAESNPKPLRVFTPGLYQQSDAFYASASPATSLNGGYAQQGTQILNSSAAAGSSAGWQVTATGYFAPLWVASTTYALDYIAQNDTGKVYAVVSPTTGSCTSAGSGGPTGTGTAITDNTCVWDYVATAVATTTTLAATSGDTTYAPVMATLTGDITSGFGTAYADITGLGQAIGASQTWEFDCSILGSADATTTGVDVAINGPSSPTTLRVETTGWSSTTVISTKLFSAYDSDTSFSSSAGTGSSNRPFRLKGYIVNGANAGTLIPRIKREAVGSGPNALTGSYCIFKRAA